jgi:putative transposase
MRKRYRNCPFSRRKRHVAVDTNGLLPGVIVHAADIRDPDILGNLPKRVKPLYNYSRHSSS